MTRTPLTDDELFAALDAEQHFGTLVEASASLGMSPQAYRYRLNVAKNKLQGYEPHYGEPVEGFSTPFLPTDKMPTDELIEHMTSRYNKRRDAKDARQPIPGRMSDDDPVGLMFFGDPHLDSPQCDWPELRRCVAKCESTEGLRGVSLGGISY